MSKYHGLQPAIDVIEYEIQRIMKKARKAGTLYPLMSQNPKMYALRTVKRFLKSKQP